jgi:hypothetical protein
MADTEADTTGIVERLRAHVETLANTPMTIALDQWSAISNDILNSADTIERQQKEIETLKRVSIAGIVLQALMPYGEELTRGQQQMLADVIDREARALLNGGSK